MTGEFSKTSVAAPITLLQYDEPTQRAEATPPAPPVLKKQGVLDKGPLLKQRKDLPQEDPSPEAPASASRVNRTQTQKQSGEPRAQKSLLPQA